MLPKTSIEIDLVNGEPTGALPQVTANPEDKNDGNGKDVHEGVLGVRETSLGLADRDSSVVAVGGEDEDAKAETNVRAIDTAGGLEGDAVHGAALAGPGSTETNVGLWAR